MEVNAGDILLIKNYQFEDGGGCKDKYLIVVSIDSNSNVIRTLTTSKQKIPDDKVRHGCCNNTDNNFSHYVFLSGRNICSNGFYFPLHTFVFYQYNIQEISVTHIKNHKDISCVGTMLVAEYRRFYKCLMASIHVPRGIRKKLEADISISK